MSQFGGSRQLQPKPPEKGIFPLDHFGECSKEMNQYLECLKQHKDRYEECKDLSRIYLECRMKNDLMAKQDLSELGLELPKS
eukprot:g6147.t1